MKILRKNWGCFVIISCFFGFVSILSALVTFWITAGIVTIWLIALWEFFAVRYQYSETALVITSGIFIRSVRTVDLSEIEWKTRVCAGKAAITVLHTVAGSVYLFADFPHF